MEHDSNDYIKLHKFTTVNEKKVFKDRDCQMQFEPIGEAKEGFHLVVAGFVQYLVYGYWSGVCNIDGEKIEIDKVLGTVEHVKARF